MSESAPTLLIAAHGTRAEAGMAQLSAVAQAVERRLPGVAVQLGFLDVAEPAVVDLLARTDQPTVLVPTLLSRGFHVLDDIPVLVARRPEIHVTRPLGPDPLLTEALIDRLGADDLDGIDRVVLVASGSRASAAAADLRLAGEDLERALGRPVLTGTVNSVELPGGPGTVFATYLLAEGFFADRIRTMAAAAGVRRVSAPLADHSAVVEAIAQRYLAAVGQPVR
jgi:sirohydrochlorin ferrochelatase